MTISFWFSFGSVWCGPDFVTLQKWRASEEQVKQLKKAAAERRVCWEGAGLSFVINTYIWWGEPRCLDDNTEVEKEGKVRNVNTTELKLRQAAIQLLREALNQIRIHRGKGS